MNDNNLQRLAVACDTRTIPADLAEWLRSALDRYFDTGASLDAVLSSFDLDKRDEYLRQAGACLDRYLSGSARARALSMEIIRFRTRVLPRYPDGLPEDRPPLDQALYRAHQSGKVPTSMKQLYRILNYGHRGQ